MFKNTKRKAFTMVELMMLLLVASLIIAACLPVITKKHFKLPSTVIHGTYLCYYKNGKLHETKWVGRAVQKKILDRDTNNCVFEPPAKAPYFQVSAIGGGGGGGDSGYTGGDPQSGINGVRMFSPFGVTEEQITNYNMSTTSFETYAGQLVAYSKGLDSGKGGNVGYAIRMTDWNTESAYKAGTPVCVRQTDVGSIECYIVDDPSCTSGSGSGDGGSPGGGSTTMNNSNLFTRMAAKVGNFFKTTLAFKPGGITGAADSGSTPCAVYTIGADQGPCEQWENDGNKIKVESQPYHIEKCYQKDVGGTWEDKYEKKPYKKWVSAYYFMCPPSQEWIKSDSATTSAGNGGACQKKKVEKDHEETYYKDELVCEKCVYKPNLEWQPCDGTTPEYYRDPECLKYGTVEKKIYSSGSATSCSPGTCQKLVCNESDGNGCLEWNVPQVFSHYSKQIWSNEHYTSGSKGGGAAGSGAKCYSKPIDGALGLTKDTSGSTLGPKPLNGDDNLVKTSTGGYYCTPGAIAGDGYASCESGTGSTSCGSSTKATYSLTTITNPLDGKSVSAQAYSAWKGGKGGERTCSEKEVPIECTKNSSDDGNFDPVGGVCYSPFTWDTYSSIKYPLLLTTGKCYNPYGNCTSKTLNVDTVVSGDAGADGVCESGSYSCSGTSYCGDGNNGYTLIHDYPTSSTSSLLTDSTGETWSANKIEPNGNYRFKNSYDQNWLSSGATGSPGEFRTVIVRSLKDMDMTIRIGRGGSGASLGSGNAGSDGSPTIFGQDAEHYIVKSAGGEGGAGSIQGTTVYQLPKYNHKQYLKEDACWNRSKYFAKDEAGNYTNHSDAAKAAQQELAETGTTVSSYCAAYVNAGDYEYHKSNVGDIKNSDYPTPIGIVSTVMNFVFNSNDSSDAVKRFVKFGRGGRGGGVEHNCWAGRWEVWFEGWLLKDTSVYGSKADAEAVGDSQAVSDHRYVTNACRNDWSTIPGSTGVDGALLIKW